MGRRTATSESGRWPAAGGWWKIERPSASTRPSAEAGFTLAGLIIILTITMILIAYTVPRQWSSIMRRERERQTVFVMKQYARAIREFAKAHGGTRPASMDQLKEAKLPRYVRGPKGELLDPLTGKFDWILIPPGAVTAGAPVPLLTGGGPNLGNPPPPTPPPVTGAPGPTGSVAGTQPAGGGTQFNPAASPKDYVGDFIGVRPPVSGPSMLKFNGAEQYDQWYYTVTDLDIEIKLRTMPPNPNAR